MKKGLLIVLAMLINFNLSAAGFTLCKNKFALCTKALCKTIPGKDGSVSCHCKVSEGYSVGKQACPALAKMTTGETVSSRYAPIKAYAVCSNDRPWAWCLDSPCVIDKNDPKKAACLCSTVKNKGNYIIVTDSYSKATCNTGLYSSATVKQASEVTNFLKGHAELPPFPIKVLNDE